MGTNDINNVEDLLEYVENKEPYGEWDKAYFEGYADGIKKALELQER